MQTLTDKEKRNYEKFRTELTKLSQKYGVGAPQQAA